MSQKNSSLSTIDKKIAQVCCFLAIQPCGIGQLSSFQQQQQQHRHHHQLKHTTQQHVDDHHSKRKRARTNKQYCWDPIHALSQVSPIRSKTSKLNHNHHHNHNHSHSHSPNVNKDLYTVVNSAQSQQSHPFMYQYKVVPNDPSAATATVEAMKRTADTHIHNSKNNTSNNINTQPASTYNHHTYIIQHTLLAQTSDHHMLSSPVDSLYDSIHNGHTGVNLTTTENTNTYNTQTTSQGPENDEQKKQLISASLEKSLDPGNTANVHSKPQVITKHQLPSDKTFPPNHIVSTTNNDIHAVSSSSIPVAIPSDPTKRAVVILADFHCDLIVFHIIERMASFHDLFRVGMGLIFAYLAADLTSGIIHWYLHTYTSLLNTTTPDQALDIDIDIKKSHLWIPSDFFTNCYKPCLISIPFLSLLAGYDSQGGDLCFTSAAVAFISLLAIAPQLKLWSQDTSPPIVVRILQSLRILRRVDTASVTFKNKQELSSQQYSNTARHPLARPKRDDHHDTKHFCVISGFWNVPLAQLQFFDVLEAALTRISNGKIIPINKKQKI